MFNGFKKLTIGSKIGVAFPSGSLAPEHTHHIYRELEKLGYQPILSKNAFSQFGYLAGKDAERAHAFMDLWKDPSIALIWCARGGYGGCRILDLLDFNFIRNNPKILIGMSDITALHVGFSKQVDFPTLLGPNLSLVFPQNETQMSVNMLQDTLSYLSSHKDSYQHDVGAWLRLGRATAPLIGGNLCVLTSLIGTPWQPDCRNKILVLEDVNEAPYKIDRMLFQLDKSGAFDFLKGVILCSFENCVASSQNSLDLAEIFHDYFGKKSFPVLTGFPSGHLAYQKTLPLGVTLSLDSSALFMDF